MKSRALTRHHKQRVKAKARKLALTLTGTLYTPQQDTAEIVSSWEKRADYLKLCSCSMCCNPRHDQWQSPAKRRTIQERKHYDI